LTVLGFIIYIYGTEMYPTKFRGIGCGIAMNCGKGLSIFSPLIIDLFVNVFGINPTVGLAMICLIGAPMMIFMPETLNKKVE